MRGRYQLVVVAVLTLTSVGVLGIGSAASAKTKAPGCHKTHSCSKSSGKGGPSAPMTIQVDPNPVIETYQSDVVVVVQVETSPTYAGDSVELDAPQFFSSCAPMMHSGFFAYPLITNSETITVQLDNEGNATVGLVGFECSAGSDLIEASMTDAPYFTATTELTVTPPAVTTPGVYGFPASSGTVTGGEVETGDSGVAASSVYAIFYVETDPVYAEQAVELSSPELEARCGAFSIFQSYTASSPKGATGVTGTLDDDGNAAFLFVGTSCAAGPSTVTADVLVGTRPTYTTTFNILPPQPTI